MMTRFASTLERSDICGCHQRDVAISFLWNERPVTGTSEDCAGFGEHARDGELPVIWS